MPFENLNNNHYTAAEKTAVQAALSTIETTLSPSWRERHAREH